MQTPICVKAVLVSAAVFLAACAAPGTSKDDASPEELVRKRAQQRQDFLLVPNYEAVYEYLSPGYRATHDYRTFLATQGSAVDRVGAKVLTVSCEPELCNVDIEVSYYYKPRGYKPKPGEVPATRVSDEIWIKVDGQWWLHKKTKK